MKIKGVFHFHTDFSYDSSLSLKTLVSYFKNKGYNFLITLEHFEGLNSEQLSSYRRLCQSLSDESFIVIGGYEVIVEDIHMGILNLEEITRGEDLLLFLREVKERGGVSILLHPQPHQRSKHIKLKGLVSGIEVWNIFWDGKHSFNFYAYRLFRDFQKEREAIFSIGGLDLHSWDRFSPLWLEAELESLSSESILEIIARGDFYLAKDGLRINAGSFKLDKVSLLRFLFIYLLRRIIKILKNRWPGLR